MHDPKLPPYSNYCKCAACDEYFNSETPFAMHRRGEAIARYCLTPAQMLEKGMNMSNKGYWVSESYQNPVRTSPAHAERTISEKE